MTTQDTEAGKSDRELLDHFDDYYDNNCLLVSTKTALSALAIRTKERDEALEKLYKKRIDNGKNLAELDRLVAIKDELVRALIELLAFAEDVTKGVHAIEIDSDERNALIIPARAALASARSQEKTNG